MLFESGRAETYTLQSKDHVVDRDSLRFEVCGISESVLQNPVAVNGTDQGGTSCRSPDEFDQNMAQGHTDRPRDETYLASNGITVRRLVGCVRLFGDYDAAQDLSESNGNTR